MFGIFKSKQHKHAAIIKAWAEGETIQVRRAGVPEPWVDCLKDCVPPWNSDTAEFRVKPYHPMIRYRVYMSNYTPGSFSVNVTTDADAEKHDKFVKWLSDWQEVQP